MSSESKNKLDEMSRAELEEKLEALQRDYNQLQEVYESTEVRFQAFVNNIQAAVYLLDDEGAIVFTNPFLTKLTGFSKDELLSLPGYSLIHPDSREDAVRVNQARLRGEDVPAQYDLKIRVKDDAVKWIELHMERFELHGKKYTLGTSIDVTKRKESELELRRSKEKFKAFTENLQVMVYTYNSEGQFTYANKICEEVTGYSRDELLKMKLVDIFHKDYRKIANERAQKRLSSENVNSFFHMKIVRKDGEVRWLESAGIKLEDESGVSILGNGLDVTERMETEIALKESNEKFRRLYDHSKDPMLLLDENGFFDCNMATVKYLRVKEKSDVFANYYRLTPRKQPDGSLSGDRFAEIIRQTYATGYNRFVWFFRDIEGKQLICDVSFTVIPLEQRDIIFSVWSDITEQEQMQIEVNKLRKLESVGRLAGGIAHDFNNLLTGIMGNIEIAQLRIDSKPEKAKKSLGKALKASLRAADLTQRLLTFAKGGEPVKEEEELREIIMDSAEFSLTGS